MLEKLQFSADDGGWHGRFDAPILGRFKYLSDVEEQDSTNLFLESEAPDAPPPELLQVAKATIENFDVLMHHAMKCLLKDFGGGGPDSGMWWHDDISHVREIIRPFFPDVSLTSPECLFELLSAPSLFVQESGYGYDKPCATIGCASAIDVEHGIGWLTDGNSILGWGYQADPTAFDT